MEAARPLDSYLPYYPIIVASRCQIEQTTEIGQTGKTWPAPIRELQSVKEVAKVSRFAGRLRETLHV